MGYLKGFENIARAAGYTPDFPSEELMNSFQFEIINLISEAYNLIKTSEPSEERPDENLITISLFDACCVLREMNKEASYWINWEHHDLTDEIRSGKSKSISAKRFDIYFGNWNSPKKIEYGVEAKVLIENNFKGRTFKHLIDEYIGDAGMSKYIKNIYQKRGCMIGYIVEGQVQNIVDKINIEIEKKWDQQQKLVNVKEDTFKLKYVYTSLHSNSLTYPLWHLMLDLN